MAGCALSNILDGDMCWPEGQRAKVGDVSQLVYHPDGKLCSPRPS